MLVGIAQERPPGDLPPPMSAGFNPCVSRNSSGAGARAGLRGIVQLVSIRVLVGIAQERPQRTVPRAGLPVSIRVLVGIAQEPIKPTLATKSITSFNPCVSRNSSGARGLAGSGHGAPVVSIRVLVGIAQEHSRHERRHRGI